MKPSTLETGFLLLWRQAYISPQPKQEHKFHPNRGWRFDFAFPEYWVAIEIDGGQYRPKGSHNTATAIQRDCEKMNAAMRLGWRVLRYTTRDLHDRPLQVIEEVAAMLESESATEADPAYGQVITKAM